MQRQVAQFHATAARAGRVLYIRYHVRHASFLAAPHPPAVAFRHSNAAKKSCNDAEFCRG